jgi:uncharacterized membrane protein
MKVNYKLLAWIFAILSIISLLTLIICGFIYVLTLPEVTVLGQISILAATGCGLGWIGVMVFKEDDNKTNEFNK